MESLDAIKKTLRDDLGIGTMTKTFKGKAEKHRAIVLEGESV